MVAVALSRVVMDDVDGRICWSRRLVTPDGPTSRDDSGYGRLKANMHGISVSEVDCKNDEGEKHQIRIPFPTQLNRPRDRDAASRDNVSSMIACPHCKAVYEYKGLNVRWRLLQISVPDRVPADPIPVRIEFECGREGCPALLVVHTTRSADENKNSALSRMRGSSFRILCQRGHVPIFPEDDELVRYREQDAFCNPF